MEIVRIPELLPQTVFPTEIPALATLNALATLQPEKSVEKSRGERLELRVRKRTVYNITAPFVLEERTYIAGRVEKKNSEESEIYFFRLEEDGSWTPIRMNLPLQDPAMIDGILSGICVDWRRDENGELKRDEKGKIKAWDWKTLFYHVHVENGLPKVDTRAFNEGPEHMKDMRGFKFQTPQGVKLGMLGRPQGGVAKGGRISVTYANSMEDLKKEDVEAAPLIPFAVDDDKWIGGNDPHMETRIDAFGNTRYFLCILLHRGQWESTPAERRYVVAAGVAEQLVADDGTITTGPCSPIVEIARREDFPDGPVKRKDLRRVVFAGGLHDIGAGKYELYCGISDAFAGKKVIDDPYAPLIRDLLYPKAA